MFIGGGQECQMGGAGPPWPSHGAGHDPTALAMLQYYCFSFFFNERYFYTSPLLSQPFCYPQCPKCWDSLQTLHTGLLNHLIRQ